MGQRKTEKVVTMAGREQERREAEAALLCEAMSKEDPSKEAKGFTDALLDANPEEWRRHGELTREAMELAFKGFWLGYLTKESVRRGAELLKSDLGFEEATPAERVLIEHAVLCHVRLGMVEHLYSRQTTGSYRIDVVEHWERRLTLTQKRFTRAVTTLARVRGLLARAESARDAAARARTARAVTMLRQAAG